MRRFMEVEGIELKDDLMDAFLKWINLVRDTFQKNMTETYISSRRIQYILKIYKRSGNFSKSLELALSRYSEEDRSSFMLTWKACYKD